VRVGPLWGGPPWPAAPAGATPVIIDPGRAFGTGAHPTTRLCLELLLELPRGSLLDIGCGSGVLAIAGARLGFAPVLAIDVAEAAIEATRANARCNHVEIEVRCLDALTDELPPVDTALANIALEPMQMLGARLRAPHLVTSGYLASEELELPGYRRLTRRRSEGWAADLHVLR
jgi:ribosomal protein L11 methyltransferase